MAEQPYQSLYRRYRPQRFSEVRGQDHVTRALRNAVRDQKVAHAYLFSGPRGTGKTSTARILAKALNCTNLQDGEPCGLCESCVQVQRGSSLDVVELDAASNRKLDEMRDLLSRVALGTPGRWKVYIIDEVHQLTGDASSALLKTLEEPPAHVIFVLATTDPQKVLPTIRSRTQHFEFRLLPGDVLATLVRDVNEAAGLGVAPEAIDLVVRKGSGSARDALSVLDQVAAAGEVSDDAAIVDAVVEALCARDAGSALVAVAEGMAAGRDPRQLAIDLVAHLRNAFLATQAKSLVALPDEALAHVEDQAHRMGVPALVRAMETLGETQVEMREALDTRVSLEVALVRIARPEADVSPAALLERVERLERGLSGHVAAPAVAEARQAVASPAPATASRSPETAPPPPPPTGGRPALGAHRRPQVASAPTAPPPTPAAPNPAAPNPAAPSPAAPGTDPSAPQASASASVSATPAPESPTRPPLPSTPPPRPPAAGPGLPSRDEVTKAWGDGVFASLKGMTKALYAGGRFTAVEDGVALFALPDEIHRARCEERRAEVEAALESHFGASVPLRLIVDQPPPEAGATAEPDADIDIASLEDAAGPITTPEERLKQAFPGAQEVSNE